MLTSRYRSRGEGEPTGRIAFARRSSYRSELMGLFDTLAILITLAALGSVPRAELEAAEVDRLPWLKRFWYVVLPHAKFILMLGIVLRTIDAFKVMDLIYQLTRGGPGNATEVIGITLFRKAFEGVTMGWSSALAVITLLIAIAFTSIFLYILNLRRRGAQN